MAWIIICEVKIKKKSLRIYWNCVLHVLWLYRTHDAQLISIFSQNLKFTYINRFTQSRASICIFTNHPTPLQKMDILKHSLQMRTSCWYSDYNVNIYILAANTFAKFCRRIRTWLLWYYSFSPYDVWWTDDSLYIQPPSVSPSLIMFIAWAIL